MSGQRTGDAQHHPTCCYAKAGDYCYCAVQPADAHAGSRDETRPRTSDARKNEKERETMRTQHRIYVASSWRNTEQPAVVAALRADGHEVYDFKNPAPDDNGFSWRQIEGPPREEWTAEHFSRVVLDHPVAKRGFDYDMTALAAASACVIVLPCGRSAHLEHGYAVGRGKLTIVYQPVLDEPELMYRMCDYFATTLDEVRLFLSRDRPRPRWQRDLEVFDARGTRGGREYEGQAPCALTASVYRNPTENAGLPERGPCREYHHRECVVCGGCWRHGACTCGPVAPKGAA